MMTPEEMEQKIQQLSDSLSAAVSRITELEALASNPEDVSALIEGDPGETPWDSNDKVAVDKDADPGFLGESASVGVLRAAVIGTASSDNGLHYADGANFITLSHGNTSSQANVTGSGGIVIVGLTLDDAGHVTGITTKDLDDRYIIVPGGEGSGQFTMPQGVLTGDMLVWTSSNVWDILTRPDQLYKVLQNTGGPVVIGWDWVRGHS